MPLRSEKVGNAAGYAGESLFYDTEEVSLVAVFGDQLSAYRARNNWLDILNNYFLLEPERDFEMKVVSSHEKGRYSLHCYFSSACGRYAFWRLINRQAPEAERQLGMVLDGHKKAKKTRSSGPDFEADPWYFGSLMDQIQKNEESKGLLERILEIFR